jgi:hypothetical protein
MKWSSFQKRVSKFTPKRFYSIGTSGLYYKNITIINDNSIVVRMMLQVVASHMIIILTATEVSFILLKNIYSTGITRDNGTACFKKK